MSRAAHRELSRTQERLQHIYNSINDYRPPTRVSPVIDSSIEVEGDQWSQQQQLPGLKKLRDIIKIDLDLLDKFLDDPNSAHLPPLSTNAPYLITVWNEFLHAETVTAIFKSFPLQAPHSLDSTGFKKKDANKPPAAKVDIVADSGRRWIRVNTIKNSRLLAEFREIDSYLTDSSSDSDDGPTLAATDLDNSVLRMAQILTSAAKLHPADVAGDSGAIASVEPKITLCLTRLQPIPEEPRIQSTLDHLRDMGVDVVLGEKPEIRLSSTPPPMDAAQRHFHPSIHINLDLSLLIALVSDLSHAPLPLSIEEANSRFLPPSGDHNTQESTDLSGDTETLDLRKHSRALTNQLLQEMSRSLIQELRDKCFPLGDSPSIPKVEFWTTPEAKERCLRIVSKIGEQKESLRAEALFYTRLPEDADHPYWKGSRFPADFVPVLPIKLLPSDTPPASFDDSGLVAVNQQNPFFRALEYTCDALLKQEEKSPLPQNKVQPRRATPMRVSPRLTAHTVKSLLWGARLGWTTITANRTSVKAILREMTTRLNSPTSSGDNSQAAAAICDEDSYVAALWLVDPRSLAEGMALVTE